MRKNLYLFMAVTVAFAACSGSSDEVTEKKEELKGYTTELQELAKKISALEKEIAELDPKFAEESDRSILVTTIDIAEKPFEHKIEVRGQIESRKNVSISAELPGKVQSISVKEGQFVTKGQILLSLDANVTRNGIAEIQTSLDLAKDVYERQKRLREKNIGTEMQYLEAKNNKESLEAKLRTMNSQLAQAIVKAPFDGTIDMIDVKLGESAMPGSPIVRIVNPFDVYIKADVSERYLGEFMAGDKVEVYIPTFDKTVMSSIASVGQVLKSANRTFEIEVLLPKLDVPVRPNQVTVLNLTDFQTDRAIVIPSHLIQKDNIGEYVYAVDGNNMVAKKKHVSTGLSYNNQIVVLKGLKAMDKVIDKGFRELTDGVLIKFADSKEVAQKN